VVRQAGAGGGRVLTLVRHAKSSWSHDLDDFQRPLNRRGLRDCVRLRSVLAVRLARPDLVLASDAARAVQTCQVFGDALGVSGEATRFEHGLYEAGADALLSRVRDTDDGVSHLALVGHNPGLTDLYNRLCDEYLENLPTFGVAVLVLPAPGWAGVEEHSARLDELILPKSV